MQKWSAKLENSASCCPVLFCIKTEIYVLSFLQVSWRDNYPKILGRCRSNLMVQNLSKIWLSHGWKSEEESWNSILKFLVARVLVLAWIFVSCLNDTNEIFWLPIAAIRHEISRVKMEGNWLPKLKENEEVLHLAWNHSTSVIRWQLVLNSRSKIRELSPQHMA